MPEQARSSSRDVRAHKQPKIPASVPVVPTCCREVATPINRHHLEPQRGKEDRSHIWMLSPAKHHPRPLGQSGPTILPSLCRGRTCELILHVAARSLGVLRVQFRPERHIFPAVSLLRAFKATAQARELSPFSTGSRLAREVTYVNPSETPTTRIVVCESEKGCIDPGRALAQGASLEVEAVEVEVESVCEPVAVGVGVADPSIEVVSSGSWVLSPSLVSDGVVGSGSSIASTSACRS